MGEIPEQQRRMLLRTIDIAITRGTGGNVPWQTDLDGQGRVEEDDVQHLFLGQAVELANQCLGD